MFNSMESQKAMLVLDSIQLDSVEFLSGAMNYVSKFLTFVLAFLMVYANQFLIKRRKKELGIYMTLGMSRQKISMVLVVETLLIGLISLFIGIAVGIIGSHFLSIITARLFLVDLKDFRFIFSLEAFLQSIMAYGLIFAVMIVLNVFNILKVKLIDLLYAKVKNEKLKLKNVRIAWIVFISSIFSLVYGYLLIQENGMLKFDMVFTKSILFGVLGTLMFFMSLSTIMIESFKKNKKLYYHHLNIFSLRQLNSKINTTFIIMSVICLMLLVAIGTFSTGIATTQAVNANQLESQPFDVSVIQHIRTIDSTNRIELPGQHYKFYHYETDLKVKDLIGNKIDGDGYGLSEVHYTSISLEDYNNLQEFRGLNPIQLKDKETILIYNMEVFHDYYQNFESKSIMLNGHKMVLSDIKYQSLTNFTSPNELGVLVADKNWLSDDIHNYYINSYVSNKDERLYADIIEKSEYAYTYLSKQSILSEAISLTVIISYISIYVGIVFIMSSVVILSLQQLSEASDNAKRYDLLRKLGVDDRQIKHSILTQLSIYFLLPLCLAIIHSAVGINVSSKVVKIIGNLDILTNMLITSGFVLIIYGSYFMITYITIKSMVLNKN